MTARKRLRHQCQHWAVANLLIGRYGRQAATEAAVRAEESDAKGDREGREIWRSVRGALVRNGDSPRQFE